MGRTEMDTDRVRQVRPGVVGEGPVVYWMHRSHRAADNEGLLYASQLAFEKKAPLAVVYVVSEGYMDAPLRAFGFLLRGMEQVVADLRDKAIPLFVRRGNPPDEVLAFVRQVGASALVTDFDPVRTKKQWLSRVVADASVPVFEADGRNVVPCWVATDKREYGAYTIRPRIHRRLDEFLTEPPTLYKHPWAWPDDIADIGDPAGTGDMLALLDDISIDREVSEVDWLTPGEAGARQQLDTFISKRLNHYEQRNDPNKPVLSDLSPYLHFGMLSARTACLAVGHSDKDADAKDAFLEECIVRRELADNFVCHTDDYDRVACLPDWAQKTIDEHAADERDYLYEHDDFEAARTHDDLWNAAQMQMVTTGKMHGYMRMYWGKKILEWTPDVQTAMDIAIALNDRYELDGRDPNGYAGVAWCMGGVHDRAWKERPVFGKLRYMNYNGAKSKFDVARYIADNLPQGK